MDRTLDGVRPFWVKLLHLLPPSMSHKLGITVLKDERLLSIIKRFIRIPRDERLVIELMGIRIDNPIGLAAGYDKDGILYPSLSTIGLGFYTIGSVTLKPRRGNRKKLLRRLSKELGLLNSLGIPSKGFQAVKPYLKNARGRSPIMLNIAPTTPEELRSLLEKVEEIEAVRFVEVNISCPNNFKNMEIWEALEAMKKPEKPVFIKLGLDHMRKIDEIANVCERNGLGLTVLNALKVDGKGGVSGLPLYPYTLRAVNEIRKVSEKVPVIAVGGVLTGRQALELIKAGADAIGILTAMVYRGPSVFRNVVEELIHELECQGFEDLKQARGYGLRSEEV